MVIERVKLKNFGTYRGFHEADLTPLEGQPVTLIGGFNGGGKTTFLDAIKLAFYGERATISNRGRLSYREYLQQSINREVKPGEGASVAVKFRRQVDGQDKIFEVERRWRLGSKGIEDSLWVSCDGAFDEAATENWDESIESYLPSNIAHLFFFDGEQIATLADGARTKEILGAAIHSLLGLDLVNSLETNLGVYEIRKKRSAADPATRREIDRLQSEIESLDREEGELRQASGALRVEADRLAKRVKNQRQVFQAEGGEAFLRKDELESRRVEIQATKRLIESQVRQQAAALLPLTLIRPLLEKVERQLEAEIESRTAMLLLKEMEERDRAILDFLTREGISDSVQSKARDFLGADRRRYSRASVCANVLDADDRLGVRIGHLTRMLLPQASAETRRLLDRLREEEEKSLRVDTELARVPAEDRMALLQQNLDEAQRQHEAKQGELVGIELRLDALDRARQPLRARLERQLIATAESDVAEDTRIRILKHSRKVRATLESYRRLLVDRHVSRIEVLMLESFQNLMRKRSLATVLKIDPVTFEATLSGTDGKELPFDRLSAGERQLLATALLWGLARASGRTIPMIIDTPLGRLDSLHRKHLVERYFPCASHQVVLLSTDQEIVGGFFDSLAPYVARGYTLEVTDDGKGTRIQKGYFEQDATIR